MEFDEIMKYVFTPTCARPGVEKELRQAFAEGTVESFIDKYVHVPPCAKPEVYFRLKR